MIRYRTWLFAGALLGSLLFLATWRGAELAPGVRPAGESLAVPLDDDAIYFQYARQALHGEWLRYNPGDPVSTGVTSPLYLGLLTALMGLGLTGPWAAWLLGLAALLLGLVSADRLGRRLFPDLPAWWFPFLLLAQGSWAALHFNGLETGLFLGLSLALLDALTDDSGAARAWALLALLAFTRPEGQVLALLLGLPWLAQRQRLGRLPALLVLAAGPSLLLLAVSGSIIPDSVRPKSALLQGGRSWLEHAASASAYAMGVIKGAWMGFWGGADAVGTAGGDAAHNPVGPLFPPLALAGALLGAYSLAAGGRRWLGLGLLAGLAGLLALLAWELPVGWHEHRYLSAATPLLMLGLGAALQALRPQGPLGRGAAVAAFTLWAGFGLASWPWHLQRCFESARDYALANRNAAVALRQLPPGPVAVVDSGLLAYYGGHPIVDLLGITDHALALANAQGKGALLEALLHLPQPPLAAALHQDRPDFDPGLWVRLGLLADRGPLAQDMRLYAWLGAGAQARRQAPVGPLKNGARVLGSLDLGWLPDEAAHTCVFLGSDPGGCVANNLRLWPGGPQVPEGGRKLEALRCTGLPAGTRSVLLRAMFDQPGRVNAGRGGAWSSTAVAPGDGQTYSQVLLPLAQAADGAALTLSFDGGQTPGAGGDGWALYRVWFLDRP